ncbi:MAG: amino acid ABC transporter permease [Hyphomicrobiales bacterium]|nr:MAG: amino acid ABC transporter permease [Hyphomicrobiales bacterium]
MTIANDVNIGEPFRIGMLINDQRYRSYTIQIVALLLLMLAFAFLISNAISNLAALGKDFSFSFLFDPASYDINQRLIEYNSQSPHWHAALVGILNTLLVAVLGCIMATFIGVTAGVLRLSDNWLISKIMLVYIEAIRNVPVLIWILILAAVVNEFLPPPSMFRETVDIADRATPYLGGFLVMTNRGFYIPSPIWEAGSNIVVWTFALSFVAAWLFGKWAAMRQASTGMTLPTFWIKLAIILLPAIIVYYAMGSPISLDFPVLKRFNFEGGYTISDSLIALWLALSIYTGAFIAENVRAGIQAISHGQSEAAHALGLPAGRTMNLVILPQALRIIIPPLISQYLNLTKNSSLAIAVGYMDATGTLGGISLNQTGREMECIVLLMAFYLIVSLLISGAMNVYNNSVKLVER